MSKEKDKAKSQWSSKTKTCARSEVKNELSLQLERDSYNSNWLI